MEHSSIDIDQAKQLDSDRLFELLGSTTDGLSEEDAAQRLRLHGPNAIEEERQHVLLKLLGYFWGPIPWMIEVAALLSAVVRHWTDFAVVLIMLLVNALVAFWQEYKAANAIDALKEQLALTARVKRLGRWRQLPASELVPGDVIRVRLGDVVPADIKLLDGDYLSIDESALTGESLPVDKQCGDIAYSSSVVKQGEMVAVVVATATNTYFATTARLAQTAGAVSHFQRAVLHIGRYLIYISLGLAAVLVLTQLTRGAGAIELSQFVLVLVVASIPVAMPAVLSVTMALGALTLSKSKAIVARLQAIEELAGIDVLCSDKTGTLTQNRLTLNEPVLFEAKDAQAAILAASLACKAEDQDVIDQAVMKGLERPDILEPYQVEKFVPFDPKSKRTEATVKDAAGRTFAVTKGAPQVVIDLCVLEDDVRQRALQAVDQLASQGFRALAVARADQPTGPWKLLGILPLYDPPREDSADTIRRAEEHGISVKMVTGDHLSIARETCRQLGLKPNVQSADAVFARSDSETLSKELEERIERAEGFAQVFPEHKYKIVKALQELGHLVGMTGDGVNDTPALKQADVGIAVAGATSAARAASALVLTAPGLGVIVKAVEEARRIFERMTSYAIYRITETIRIMFFVVLTMIVFDFYPITTVMIILLALLNDLPIITIAYDRTWLNPKPVRWQMHRVLTLATVLGLLGVVETFGLLLIGKMVLGMSESSLQSFIYLKLAVAGHLTLLVVRSRREMLRPPYPAPVLLGAVLGTQAIAVLIVRVGIFVTALPWAHIGLVWAYCLVWAFIEDWAKLRVYEHLDLAGKAHVRFLHHAQRSLHSHPT
jgi:H+-transporting ATPase